MATSNATKGSQIEKKNLNLLYTLYTLIVVILYIHFFPHPSTPCLSCPNHFLLCLLMPSGSSVPMSWAHSHPPLHPLSLMWLQYALYHSSHCTVILHILLVYLTIFMVIAPCCLSFLQPPQLKKCPCNHTTPLITPPQSFFQKV